KTATPLPTHAHVCPEGYYVGIYIRQGTDSLGNTVTEHVAPVDKFGENLYPLPRVVTGDLGTVAPEIRGLYDLQPKSRPDDADTYVLKASFPHVTLEPGHLVELHHAEDISHLPPHRIAKTLAVDPNHQLPAWHRRQQAKR